MQAAFDAGSSGLPQTGNAAPRLACSGVPDRPLPTPSMSPPQDIPMFAGTHIRCSRAKEKPEKVPAAASR